MPASPDRRGTSGSGPVKADTSAFPHFPRNPPYTSSQNTMETRDISAGSHPEPGSMAQTQKRKRVRNWTAEDRAVHREFEKSRREAFSERLMVSPGWSEYEFGIGSNIVQELAGLLPMLNIEQRPSKHVIVEASVSYHKSQQARNDQATGVIRELMAERDELLQELNALRSLCEPTTATMRQARPIDPAVLAMLTGTHDPGTASWNPLRRVSVSKNTESSAEQVPSLPSMAQTPMPPQMSRLQNPYSTPNPPPLTYNPTDWTLQAQDRGIHPSTIPVPSDGAALHWARSPDFLTTTPPKDMDLIYDATPSRLLDDAALFWTQHPGVLSNTPRGMLMCT
ncbi:hypothetical protein N7492_006294 [Penicillium capsulatum]|uniref:BHLH domain-containing protein n=1 Tax=Penicillium capsulatum TaxID=69766 RepID=A0A9W9LMU3_9EURO|nr:hypothetical protein N7492_006294 [Penicillium capsulatum]KAJ6108944.1 hypothetical protein N7512_008781 [Penicillium capsulatum]